MRVFYLNLSYLSRKIIYNSKLLTSWDSFISQFLIKLSFTKAEIRV